MKKLFAILAIAGPMAFYACDNDTTNIDHDVDKTPTSDTTNVNININTADTTSGADTVIVK